MVKKLHGAAKTSHDNKLRRAKVKAAQRKRQLAGSKKHYDLIDLDKKHY